MCLIAQSVVFGLIAFYTMRIPKLFPEAWAKSKFHVSDTALKVLCSLAVAANVFNLVLNMSGLDTVMITSILSCWSSVLFTARYGAKGLRWKYPTKS